jgi:hypothetical protein
MLTSVNDTEQTDYTGVVFIGLVVDNDDPQRLQRVRVTIKGLYEGSVADLPWVAPKVGLGFGNAGGAGRVSVPLLNSKIYVELQNGDSHYPVYTGSVVHLDAPVTGGSINYPHRYIQVDRAGNSITVDPIPGSNVMTIQHASGTQITVNNDGSINITATGDITSSAPTWTHTGDMVITGDIEVTGDLDVTGTVDATVDVKAGPLNISVVTHRHPGVVPGGGTSGSSVP